MMGGGQNEILGILRCCVHCCRKAAIGAHHRSGQGGRGTQLRGFKAGTRFDMDGNMTSAVQALSDSDVEILADYLAGLK